MPRLRAQADPTADAPGVNVAPAPAPAATLPPPSPMLAPMTGENLVPNGDFQAEGKTSGQPDGWKTGGGITWEKEGDRRFMRLVQQTPGKLLMLYREVKIPAGTPALEIAFQYRTAGVKKGGAMWFDARAIFNYLDAGRQKVKPEPKAMVFNSTAWKESVQRVLVPEGATMLVLMPSLFQVKEGTLDIAQVRVTALDAAAAADIVAAKVAEEKKKAERDAVIAQEMAQPSALLPIRAVGNKLMAGDAPIRLRGVNVESLEWSATGDNLLWTVHIATKEWKANIVRLPVFDGFWFGKGKGGITNNDAEAYRKLIDDAVKLASANGAYLLLDLHRFLAPTDDNVDFWKDAAARYKDNPAVLFDLFNEPHDISWEVWHDGGMVPVKDKEPYHTPGMQALVDAVRGTGAKNLIVAGGLSYAYDLSGILKGFALDDKGGNGIMYATHFYNWHKGWESHFLGLADKYPILVGEFGADVKKMNFIPADQQEDPYTWVPDALGMVEKYQLNWTAFSLHPKSTPVLISDWDYTPTPFWGVFVKEALAGKQFEMKRMR